jgi:IS30 family transposase
MRPDDDRRPPFKISIHEKKSVNTITFDNGTEFAGHAQIAKKLKAEIYFARPYKSCDRGLNEHTNGLIRQYLPKKQDFENVSHQKIRKIENKLNHRPRKVLGYKTPFEIFFGHDASATDGCPSLMHFILETANIIS